ncbi:hypothetical protein DFP72DRAFT_1072008 [Ephemerocybe angulata]|uniref:Uncharacterized protein n=1 Tax=Ephemerocybe angulata TaxID=980116 RepID=A0A8H6HPJ6_9AGAR|nr:hypothetical protein DFP72DRAFT_1072008 [Tulosesus angulatus]
MSSPVPSQSILSAKLSEHSPPTNGTSPPGLERRSLQFPEVPPVTSLVLRRGRARYLVHPYSFQHAWLTGHAPGTPSPLRQTVVDEGEFVAKEEELSSEVNKGEFVVRNRPAIPHLPVKRPDFHSIRHGMAIRYEGSARTPSPPIRRSRSAMNKAITPSPLRQSTVYEDIKVPSLLQSPVLNIHSPFNEGLIPRGGAELSEATAALASPFEQSQAPGQLSPGADIIVPRLTAIPGDVPEHPPLPALLLPMAPSYGGDYSWENIAPVQPAEVLHRSPYRLRGNREVLNKRIRQQLQPTSLPFDEQHMKVIKKHNPKLPAPPTNVKLLYLSCSPVARGITLSQMAKILRCCGVCTRYIYVDRAATHSCGAPIVDVLCEEFYMPHMMVSEECPGLTARDMKIFFKVCDTCLHIYSQKYSHFHECAAENESR